MTGPLLHATGVVKRFGQTVALDGASMSVRAGEVVAVMGPSGSGKSTLLHCLAGIVQPDAGTVTYAGRELSTMPDMPRSALRRTEFGQQKQVVPGAALEFREYPIQTGSYDPNNYKKVGTLDSAEQHSNGTPDKPVHRPVRNAGSNPKPR